MSTKKILDIFVRVKSSWLNFIWLDDGRTIYNDTEGRRLQVKSHVDPIFCIKSTGPIRLTTNNKYGVRDYGHKLETYDVRDMRVTVETNGVEWDLAKSYAGALTNHIDYLLKKKERINNVETDTSNP